MLNDLYEESGVLKHFQTNYKKNQQAKEFFLILVYGILFGDKSKN